MYRLSLTLTESTLLQIDAGYNLAQALTDLADMLDDLDGEARSEEIHRLREEAKDVLERVLQGQEEYLRSISEEVDVSAAEATVDTGESEADMEVDDPQGDEAGTATYETHLPTPSSFVDTLLSLIDIYISLWQSTGPSRTPTDLEHFRSLLDRAPSLTPDGRQPEFYLAEIKVLLTMDGIVWDTFGAEARTGVGVEKSLEGAVAALEALLASLDICPPDEKTVRADIITTLANTHSTIANRMLFLSPQLPPGPSPLAQRAWYHFLQAVSQLSNALNLPTTTSTPRLFKPSTLLALSQASLSRARLATVNETAKRHVSQLMENATTYANQANDLLGWSAGIPPFQSGWDAELLGRNLMLHQLRINLYGSKTDLMPDAKDRFTGEVVRIMERIKGVKDEERRVKGIDLERWIGEIEGESSLGDGEKEWWIEIRAGLGD